MTDSDSEQISQTISDNHFQRYYSSISVIGGCVYEPLHRRLTGNVLTASGNCLEVFRV